MKTKLTQNAMLSILTDAHSLKQSPLTIKEIASQFLRSDGVKVSDRLVERFAKLFILAAKELMLQGFVEAENGEASDKLSMTTKMKLRSQHTKWIHHREKIKPTDYIEQTLLMLMSGHTNFKSKYMDATDLTFMFLKLEISDLTGKELRTLPDCFMRSCKKMISQKLEKMEKKNIIAFNPSALNYGFYLNESNKKAKDIQKIVFDDIAKSIIERAMIVPGASVKNEIAFIRNLASSGPLVD